MKKKDINDFLSGNLNDNEHENFKNELENNEEFLEEVANEVITEYGRVKLKNRLNVIDKQVSTTKRTSRTYLLVAVMMLALGIPLMLNMMNGNISEEKLFSAHFSPYKTVLSIRGNENGDVLLSSGMLAYSKGSYQEAINNFEAINDKSYVVNFYLGVAPPKGEESIKNLDVVLSLDNDFHQQATWYKALALLVLKKKEEAKVLFENIKQKKWFNYEKAVEVLEGM